MRSRRRITKAAAAAAPPPPKGAELTAVVAQHALRSSVAKSTYVLGPESSSGMTPAEAVAKAAKLGDSWVVEVPGGASALVAAMKAAGTEGSVFWSPLQPTSLFVSNEEAIAGESVLVLARKGVVTMPVVAPPAAASTAKNFERQVKLLKDDGATDEERFVLGVVLEPETKDSQDDIYSAEEVRSAAHGFMQNWRQLGKQHSEIVTGKLEILETYIAPVDFTVGEESVKKGTWMMGIRVVDDELWGSVKKGDFTGFSIGGSAVRTPEATT